MFDLLGVPSQYTIIFGYNVKELRELAQYELKMFKSYFNNEYNLFYNDGTEYKGQSLILKNTNNKELKKI